MLERSPVDPICLKHLLLLGTARGRPVPQIQHRGIQVDLLNAFRKAKRIIERVKPAAAEPEQNCPVREPVLPDDMFLKGAHKRYGIRAAVLIADLIIGARISLFQKRPFRRVEGIKEFRLPDPLPVRAIGNDENRGIAVQYKFFCVRHTAQRSLSTVSTDLRKGFSSSRRRMRLSSGALSVLAVTV